MATVLIVEDNDLVREFLRLVFQEAGYDVRSAPDGPAGTALAREASPDAVILDLRLPGMGGEEVLHRLKEMAPGVPVFIYSSYCDFAEKAGKMEEADACFVKSGDPAPLLGAVERALRTA